MTYLRLLLTVLVFISDYATQAADTSYVRMGKKSVALPTNADKVTYETIFNFDSIYTDKQIYENVKMAISRWFVQPSITTNNHLFKMNNIDRQIISEDPETKTIVANMIFITARQPNEPKDLQNDLIVIFKGKFIVRESRVKMIFDDVNYYFTSTGVALLAGPQNSLFNISLDSFTKSYKLNNYTFNRLFTVDYKMKTFGNAVAAEIIKNIKQSSF
ncbi:MAG: hypothetical protein WKF97_13930 [Chitinophagaceae bacterium]